MTGNVKNTKVVTGEVRLSYLHVFEPSAIEGSTDLKYSVSCIIKKSDQRTLKAIVDAIEGAKANGLNTKFGGKLPLNLKIPLRDGDTERPDDEAYANSYFINASSKNRPGIVDLSLNPIIDANEIYSGAYGRVSITFFPYNNVSKGIGCSLNNIQKTRDGEPLAGGSTPEDDFGALASEFSDY